MVLATVLVPVLVQYLYVKVRLIVLVLVFQYRYVLYISMKQCVVYRYSVLCDLTEQY